MYEVLQVIQMLHTEMRPLTLEAGVSVSKYERLILNVSQASDKDMRGLENWLRDVYDTTYSAACKVKDRHKQETWDRMKNFGFTSMTEVELLKKTLKALKEQWRNPYNVRNSKTTTKHRNTLHVQSEQTKDAS